MGTNRCTWYTTTFCRVIWNAVMLQQRGWLLSRLCSLPPCPACAADSGEQHGGS